MRPTRIAFVVWFSLIVFLFYSIAISLVFRKAFALCPMGVTSGVARTPPADNTFCLVLVSSLTIAWGAAMQLYFLHLRRRRSWIGYCSTCGAHLHGDSRCMTCGERQTLDEPRPRAFEVIVRRKSDSVPFHA